MDNEKTTETRRDFLRKAGVACLLSASALAYLESLVKAGVFPNMEKAKEEFFKDPFTVFEKAIFAKGESTPDNVLGRPAAIDIASLSTDEREYIPTACWQCVSRCGATAVRNKKTGVLERMEGNPNLPRSAGKLCVRGRGGVGQTYDPDRLLYPMVRTGPRGSDQWKRVSWKEALELLCYGGEIAGHKVKGLKTLRDEERPEYFMFHYGRMKASSEAIIKGYFLAAYGTETIQGHTTICEGGKWTAQELTWGKHYDVNDLENTKFILNFGANPFEAHTSHIPIAQRLMAAVADRHIPLYTFDVRMSNTAALSTEWVPIRPGTDLAVVLAMAHTVLEKELYDREFFETWSNTTIEEVRKHLVENGYTPEWAETISGVPAEKIRDLANRYATAKPGTIISYRGAVAHYNGIQTERAIIMLEALCGYINKKGGRNMAVGAKWVNSFKKPEGHGKKLKVLDGEGYAFPTHHVSQDTFRVLDEGKYGRPEIYMMYCLNAPYAHGNCQSVIDLLKDEEKLPFVVSVDMAYGEGTKYADLVLPNATYLEWWDWEDMVSYNMVPEFYIRQPVVPKPDEVRDFKDVVPEIARMCGFELPFVSAEEFVRDACENTPGVKEAGGLEYMKRYGAWYDRTKKPAFDAHTKKLELKDLEGTIVDEKTGVIWKGKPGEDYTTTKDAYKLYVGQMVKGVAHKGFTPDKVNKSGILEIRSKLLEEKGHPALPTWLPIPEHANLKDNELVLTTYKVVIHTQSRTQNCRYNSEIYHRNPAWLNPKTAAKFGVKTGDKIRITSEIGNIETTVLVREGIVPGVIAISHHCGHWAHGRYATAGKAKSPFGRDLEPHLGVWWTDNGVHPNWIIPNKGEPVAGQQRWMDTVVKVEKIS